MIYLILLFTIFFLILAWRRLDWAVMFLIAALPAYLIRFNILGLPATLLEVMIWSVFLVWVITNWSRINTNLRESFKKNSQKIKIRYPFDWEIILLLLVSFVAAGVAGFSAGALGIWKAYFFEPALFFIVVLNVMAKKPPFQPEADHPLGGIPPLQGGQKSPLPPFIKGAELVLWSLAVSALAVSLFAIYQKITGQLIENPVWAAENTRRVVSFFGYPNAVGLYLGPIVLVMTGWLFSVIARSVLFLSSSGDPALDAGENPGIQKGEAKNNLDSRLRGNDKKELVARNDIIAIIFISLTIILSLLSIYFAKSKGALLGVAVGLTVFGLMASKKIRWATVAVVLIIIAGIAAYQPARNLAVANITLSNLSGQIRQAGWSDTWKMLKDGRLLTGAGLANYKEAVAPYHQEGIFFNSENDPDFHRQTVFNEEYRKSHWQPVEIYLYPHNIILNFWSELGLAGLLLFIWIIGKFFVIGIWNLFGNCQPEAGPPLAEKLPARGWSAFGGEIENLGTQKNKYLVIGLIGAMTVIVIHGIVDVPYFKNDLAVMFWLLVAMISLINLENKYGINMGKIIYNKLVRDNIPEIIRRNKAEPQTRILEQEEFLKELFKKLEEEAREASGVMASKQELTKEIGDVYEIIDAIIDNCGLDKAEIMRLKNERKTERGGFDKKIFLESVSD